MSQPLFFLRKKVNKPQQTSTNLNKPQHRRALFSATVPFGGFWWPNSVTAPALQIFSKSVIKPYQTLSRKPKIGNVW
jgi:hypothetical protein